MRIYLAATNCAMNKATRAETLQKAHPLYILETFFNGSKDCLTAMHEVGNENFLLDSGAFSYMNGAQITLEQMDVYVERYAQFIADYKIQNFIEIDVDNIFGLQQVERWRKRLESAAGRQCIPVWHKGRGVEYWKQMCRDYPYVAIGGLVFHVKRQEYGAIQKMVSYARERGVKVHGLGFTKTRELHNYAFYSVDSASWSLSAARGRQIYFFKNGVMENRQIGNPDRKVDISKLAAHNFKEWTKYQKYMDRVRW